MSAFTSNYLGLHNLTQIDTDVITLNGIDYTQILGGATGPTGPTGFTGWTG